MENETSDIIGVLADAGLRISNYLATGPRCSREIQKRLTSLVQSMTEIRALSGWDGTQSTPAPKLEPEDSLESDVFTEPLGRDGFPLNPFVPELDDIPTGGDDDSGTGPHAGSDSKKSRG
jgi:hypothetical protein